MEAVWSELVSAVASLIYRENAEKSFETGPPGGFSAEIPKPFRSRSDRFPVIRNRELIDEQGNPGKRNRSPN